MDTNFQTSDIRNINDTKREVQQFLDKFRTPPKRGEVRAFKCQNIEYTPRFPNQHTFIERTLTILVNQYQKNFIKFIGESLKRWEHEPDGLRHVAFDLYLLTYSNIELDETVRLLNSKENQKEHYSRWARTRRFGYKRLWAALRDYRKATNYLALVQQGLCRHSVKKKVNTSTRFGRQKVTSALLS